MILAGLADAVYGIGLYYSNGFTRLWPSLLSVAGGLLTTWLLSLSMKTLPLGISFAVWCGLAAVTSVIYGMIVLGESRDLLRLSLIALIIGAVIGLKLTSTH